MPSATLPIYATISTHEIQRLAQAKASGCAVLVYQVLCSFARVNRPFAFPSQSTISEMLGEAYTLRAIQKAIKFLEDQGIIKRKASKERRSKTIHLITRKARQLAEMVIGTNNRAGSDSEAVGNENRKTFKTQSSHEQSFDRREQKKKTNFYKKKGNFERWGRSEVDPYQTWWTKFFLHQNSPEVFPAVDLPKNKAATWKIAQEQLVMPDGWSIDDVKRMIFGIKEGVLSPKTEVVPRSVSLKRAGYGSQVRILSPRPLK